MIEKRERIWHYALNVSRTYNAAIILKDLYHQLKYELFFLRTCVRKEDQLYKNALQQALITLSADQERTIGELIPWINTLKQASPAKNKSSVLITTMHKAKGLQWDCVIIPECLDSCLPMPDSHTDIEAERRIFYVAITRAKHQLYLVIGSDHEKLQQYWRASGTLPTMRQSSQFIYELGDVAAQQLKVA